MVLVTVHWNEVGFPVASLVPPAPYSVAVVWYQCWVSPVNELRAPPSVPTTANARSPAVVVTEVNAGDELPELKPRFPRGVFWSTPVKASAPATA